MPFHHLAWSNKSQNVNTIEPTPIFSSLQNFAELGPSSVKAGRAGLEPASSGLEADILAAELPTQKERARGPRVLPALETSIPYKQSTRESLLYQSP
jgi:hypothetical protein